MPPFPFLRHKNKYHAQINGFRVHDKITTTSYTALREMHVLPAKDSYARLIFLTADQFAVLIKCFDYLPGKFYWPWHQLNGSIFRSHEYSQMLVDNWYARWCIYIPSQFKDMVTCWAKQCIHQLWNSIRLQNTLQDSQNLTNMWLPNEDVLHISEAMPYWW